MKRMSSLLFLPVLLWSQTPLPHPAISFAPKNYTCFQTSNTLNVDGSLNEDAWQLAEWSDDFVDIQGRSAPTPRFRTRAKMLWDAENLYIGAQLYEPHIWAKLMQRDTVIFYDNDFEIFIDPDGDTYNYYELEINAFNTVWDLYLDKPYRDQGTALFGWDIHGLQTGISVNGTLNDASDIDSSWTVEIAIPWEALKEAAHKDAPPNSGDVWRINFSRVEWQTEFKNGNYQKKINPQTGKAFAEDNWVWSPQGLINMHYPEMWGFVHFNKKMINNVRDEQITLSPDEMAKWKLRTVYYAARNHFHQHGTFTTCAQPDDPEVKLECTTGLFQASLFVKSSRTLWHINQDGRIWETGKGEK